MCCLLCLIDFALAKHIFQEKGNICDIFGDIFLIPAILNT